MINQIKLFNQIYTSTKVGVFGLTSGLQAKYILECFEQINNNILVVVNSDTQINNLYNSLICNTSKILTFPMDGVALATADAISPEYMQERFNTLAKLRSGDNYIVITALEGYVHPILDKQKYNEEVRRITTGQELEYNTLEQFLINNMYERVSVVTQTGEYAFRGHVVDVFLEGEENPTRIELWGDEIDSIRDFDPVTQRTIFAREEIVLYPNADCQITDNYSTIADYVDGFNIMIDYPQIQSRFESIDYYSGVLPVVDINHHCFTIDSDSDLDIKKVYYDSELVTPFNSDLKLLNKFLEFKLKNNSLVIIALDIDKQIETVTNAIDVEYKIVKSYDEIDYRKVNIIVSHQTDYISTLDSKVSILNSEIIFNKTNVTRKYLNTFKFSQKIDHNNHLKSGDYVVHEKYGIGIYIGIKTIETKVNKDVLQSDFYELEYQGKDKLYVPVEQIELVQKYSSESTFKPKLNKLGGVEWEKTKRKAYGRMEEVAEKLLDIYARRENAKGFACATDSVDAAVFESEFEFTETTDQLRAINEIKADMEIQRPMDRLLCGDVGFGKTEVAFRAAFKAMDNNKQVAYLCPTTILSMQQYENAVKRFMNVPINIAILNRYTSESKKKEVYEKVSQGKIDFLIGTHSLLNEKLVYKDLGLLIVDEEQRFGVEHKEKIKSFKEDVDVLSLSATPIPRTLQMSLLGIRGLSIIDTAPINRFPIQTYVIKYSEAIIKEVVEKELLRNGQVFVLSNVISKQPQLKRLIEKLVPSAKVNVANGKMTKDEIENVFYEFNNNEFNVLIATTIIETGIDIPNANTLIILDADKFGLSQLYQIRGRVGRGENVAYAYLMYNENKVLTNTATQRLEAIKNFTSLGSGFKIASRDLSIRGAGDILGHEQAGYIDTVGFDLYMKMLKEVINKQLGKEPQPVEEQKVPLIQFSNHIPTDYVEEDSEKLIIHKKIQEIVDEKTYEEIYQEITDRYGRIPENVENYMNQVLFDIKIKEFGIIKIDNEQKFVKLLINHVGLDGKKLLDAVNKVGRHIRLSNKQNTIYLIIDKDKCEDWKEDVMKLTSAYFQ